MRAASKHATALYVDKASQQWIVRDAEGNFWSLPLTDNPWDERQPFTPGRGDGVGACSRALQAHARPAILAEGQ